MTLLALKRGSIFESKLVSNSIYINRNSLQIPKIFDITNCLQISKLQTTKDLPSAERCGTPVNLTLFLSTSTEHKSTENRQVQGLNLNKSYSKVWSRKIKILFWIQFFWIGQPLDMAILIPMQRKKQWF